MVEHMQKYHKEEWSELPLLLALLNRELERLFSVPGQVDTDRRTSLSPGHHDTSSLLP
jgi:hypothetical protein